MDIPLTRFFMRARRWGVSLNLSLAMIAHKMPGGGGCCLPAVRVWLLGRGRALPQTSTRSVMDLSQLIFPASESFTFANADATGTNERPSFFTSPVDGEGGIERRIGEMRCSSWLMA